MSEKVVNAALLGLGTVGTGVYKLIERQREELPHKVGAGNDSQAWTSGKDHEDPGA